MGVAPARAAHPLSAPAMGNAVLTAPRGRTQTAGHLVSATAPPESVTSRATHLGFGVRRQSALRRWSHLHPVRIHEPSAAPHGPADRCLIARGTDRQRA